MIAVTCGMARECLLIPALGPLAGRALGTLLVGAIIGGLIYRYVRALPDAAPKELLQLGVFWTGLTVGFECLFGHYGLGISWELLLADYNVFRGRLWPLVLVVTWFGPLWARKLRMYLRA